ncbi:unnamed protein product [Musa acuminata subsp. burmannicoides]
MDQGKLGDGATPGTWVMGTPVAPHANPGNWQGVPLDHVTSSSAGPSAGHCPSNSNHTMPPVPGASHFPSSTYGGGTGNPYVNISPFPHGSNASGNPYVNVSPVPTKSPSETILKVLGRCGKKLEDTTRKAGDVAGNVWHHLKTSPNVTDAALARLAQGTKVLAEGGNEKVFQQTFGIFPGEQLRKAYACYLSTSAGPVIGTLYLSTARIAFCSDNPLCTNFSNAQQQWAYYKIAVPLDQLRAVNPSANSRNPSEKYIQIITMDNHEFWFMGFVSYDKALKNLREALHFSPRGSYQPNF